MTRKKKRNITIQKAEKHSTTTLLRRVKSVKKCYLYNHHGSSVHKVSKKVPLLFFINSGIWMYKCKEIISLIYSTYIPLLHTKH